MCVCVSEYSTCLWVFKQYSNKPRIATNFNFLIQLHKKVFGVEKAKGKSTKDIFNWKKTKTETCGKMFQSQEMEQQDQNQQTTRKLIPTSSSSTTLRLSYSAQQNCQDQKHYQSHRNNQHHRQKHKTRRHFPRCGLILLIFLSVIKDSLTTYSTSYSTSLDAATTAPQTNFLPYFDFDVLRNITVTVGQTGFLHCRVERLGDKDVSWIRKRDLHILTAGSTTYTSDQRFQVLRPENSGNWTLQIKYPQPRDSGIYECQINTEPKMSLSYTFNVVELKATIIGPTDLYVKSGSDINLTCRIIQGPHELGNIFWYKGSEIIDMNTNQNEIDSGTRITVENDWSDGLTSRLKIRRASSSDTGNYTCVPTIAKSSSVYVHVIIGEHPAAMQHNASNRTLNNFYINLCCVLFTILTCCLQHLMYMSLNNARRTTSKMTLTKRGNSTDIASFLPPYATSTVQSVSVLAPTSTLLSTTNTTTNNIPDVGEKIQSKPSASHTKSKPFSSSALSNTSGTIEVATQTSTSTAVTGTANTCKRTRLLLCNGRISR